MRLTRRLLSATFVSSFLALAACGGGGDSDTPAASPSAAQGLWLGTSTPAGAEQRSVFGMVTRDGSGYIFYSKPGGNGLRGGLVHGKVSTTASSALAFGDARDYSFEGSGVSAVGVAGDFVAGEALNGRIDYPGGARISYETQSLGSYERTPLLAAVLGTFRGEVLLPGGGVPSFDISVSTDGSISGGVSACAVSGSVTPRADGNLFDVVIAFGPAPCIRPLQTFTGVAFYNIGTTDLTAGAVTASRSDALVYLARKR